MTICSLNGNNSLDRDGMPQALYRSHAGLGRRLELPDGRPVSLLDMGATDGRLAVIALHGTPGSGLKFLAAHERARQLGIRLVAPDRWGYGGTARPAAPSLEAYAGDLSAIADALGIGEFMLLGVSGGGPYAAVAAGLLRDRVVRVALAAPVGPMAGTGTDGPNRFHRLCFLGLPRIPGLMRGLFAGYRALALKAPEVAIRIAAARACQSDRAILADAGQRAALAAAFAAGLAHQSSGPAIDMRLFSQPWSTVPLSALSARVWIGLEDGNVPLGPARLLARQIQATATEVAGAGHYWINANWPEILDWLAAASPQT